MVAPLAAVLALAVAGCGDTSPRGFDVGTLSDCAAVGTPQTVTDPAHDARGDQPDGRADLVRASLSRGRNGLCADVRTADPVGPTTLYALVLRPRNADRPVVAVEVGILAGTSPEITLRRDTGRPLRDVAGAIAVKGRRMTVRVDRAPLERVGAQSLLGDGRWEVRTLVAGRRAAVRSDCAPSCV